MSETAVGPLRVRLAVLDKQDLRRPPDPVALANEPGPGKGAEEGSQAASDSATEASRAGAGSENLSGLALPTYHEAWRLTKQPQLIGEIPDTVPATLPSGFLGNVRLVLLLNELGVIDRIVVQDSALSAELTKAVVEPFKAVRFTPGEIDGIPVKCAYTVLVDLAAED